MKVSQSGKFDETGSHEDSHRKEEPELPLLQRIRSLELPASEIAAQINASVSSSHSHISTSTVQRRLCESDLHGRIAAKKPLLKDTNNKKRLARAMKHKQWILAWWKSVLWSDESYFVIVGSIRRVYVRRRVGDLFRIQGTLNQHGYHSILQRYPIPFSLG